MSSIDERVVEMKFNNGQFERNISTTSASLEKLNANLKLDGATAGLDKVNAAAKNMQLGHIGQAVDTIASKFSALSVVAVTALATITNKAMTFGGNMVKSLTLEPLQDGLSEYEMKMGAIQTMLANTAKFGTSLKDVTAALEELNTYSDKTIYNFGDMVKNVSLFTNAGMRIEEATAVIKGFSNEAAVSGVSAQNAAGAAYQLSQALSAGVVKLIDWKSLTNAGMGNKNMQNSLIEIADAMGVFKGKADVAKLAAKNFNGSLEKGWLTADVMTNYLKIQAGELSDEQMHNLGLTGKQISAFKKQAKTAQDAATKVRTATQLFGTIRESIGSGWATTFELIIGDFDEATKLWTGVNNTLGKMLTGFGERRNQMLEGWKEWGGRDALIKGVSNAFQALLNIIRPVSEAFRAVFPATTGKQLAEMTKSFAAFTEKLKMGPENMERLKTTFEGLFSILGIGWSILKGVVRFFTSLFGMAQNGGGGFLALTSAVGAFLIKIREWIESSGAIEKFFDVLISARDAVLRPLIEFITRLVDAFSSLAKGDTTAFVDKLKNAFSAFAPLVETIRTKFSSFVDTMSNAAGTAKAFLESFGQAALQPIVDLLGMLGDSFDNIKERLSSLAPKVDMSNAVTAARDLDVLGAASSNLNNVWDGMVNTLKGFGDSVRPIIDSILEFFALLKDKLMEYIRGLDMGEVVALINTGFFIMFYRAAKQFFDKMGGIADSISGVLDGLTDSLKTMQQDVKSQMILRIAIAVGILAASLYVLSRIEPAQLATALGAVAGLLIMLTFTMKSMMSTMDSMEKKGLATIGTIVATGGAMVLLAGAVLLLSIAVKNLSGLSWEEMARGLIATGALLGALTLFTKFAETDKQSIKGAASLIVLAGAVYLLSIGVSKLGEMDTGKLVQGGVALAAIIAMLTTSSVLISKFGGKGAAGILAMAAALAILVPVVITLGLIPFDVLKQGLTALGIALAMMTASLVAIGLLGGKAAPGILAMSLALVVMAGAIAIFGNMDMMTLAQGLIGLAAALTLMTASTVAMGLFGAQAAPGLLAMSVALVVLTGAIVILGSMDWQALALGLGALAVGLGILLVAAAAAIYLSPGLLVLGVTLGMLGAAMLMAGVGFAAFAAGFAVLAAVGTAGFAVLLAGFEGLLNLIPLFAQQVGLGLIAIAKVISDSGPVIVDAITTVLIAFLKAIERAAPQFFKTMETLIMGLVKTIARLIPQIAQQGAQMILRLLTVIGAYVGPMADKATTLMVNFIRAIGRNVPRLVDAGMKAIVDFLNGIANAIRNNQRAMEDAGANIASAIVEGLVGGIGRGISAVTNAAKNLAKSALNAAKGFLGIKSPSREFAKLGKYSAEGYAKGLLGSKEQIKAAGKTMQDLIAASMKNATDDVARLEKRLKSLKNARHKDNKAIKETSKQLAEARAELKKSKAAEAKRKTFTDEMKQLDLLAYRYDKLKPKLEAAMKVLEDAKKVRDDYAKSITDQYDDLPEITGQTTVMNYMKVLSRKIENTKKFATAMQKLRDLGLNDTLYKELLAKGPDALPFINQLLSGGKERVDEVNALSDQMESAAKDLGGSASKALYQAAVDSAQGIVDGLKAQEAAIQKEMNKIAAAMVKAIKKALGIKSPSRVFKEVGGYSADGLIKGLNQNTRNVERASAGLGNAAINSMRKTIVGISDLVDNNVDVNPTIRPVLDLTDVQKDAAVMNKLFEKKGIDVGGTYSRANQLALAYAGAAGSGVGAAAPVSKTLNYNQYISSPKPVNNAELYRQSRNQLSQMKGDWES